MGHRGAPDREARPGASPTLLEKARVYRDDPLSPGFIGPIWTQFNRLSTWIQPVVHSDSTGCPRWPRQDAPPTASTSATRVSLNDHVAGCFKRVKHRSGPLPLLAAFVGVREYGRIAEPDQVVI